MYRIFAILAFVVVLCGVANAQTPSWSGIIDPSRAIDWSSAGIPGGIPNRTQCGATIQPYNGDSSTINTAIANASAQPPAGCGPGSWVIQLGAGTFNLSSGIDFGGTSNVTVRGAGADQTYIVFSGDASCNGLQGSVCMAGSNSGVGYEQNVCDWTGGYTQGATSITLAHCGSTTPAVGSLSNLHAGSILILDQVDETGDTGTIWNCLVANSCSNGGSGGDARTDGPCVNSVCNRSQQQGVIVTNISGSTITIAPGLYMPNWRSSQSPQAWFANSYVTMDGVEDLSIDSTNAGSAVKGVLINGCYGCWVKGVRSLYAGRSHVQIEIGSHNTVENSYFYQNQAHGTVSYGVELNGAWDSLIQNNICQQVTDNCPANTGAAEGNVISYNYCINTIYTVSAGWFMPCFEEHASGNAFNLWEGNIGGGWQADNVHGTHHFDTTFRSYLIGTQASCDGSPCSAQTIPVQLYAGSRYFNVIGNVLGTSGKHNNYTCVGSASTCTNGNTSIYALGFTGNGGKPDTSITGFCSSPSSCTLVDYDPQTTSYLMRWGNYDTVNAVVQWNSSEVPSGISPFGNSVPASHNLPASFYLSQKPTWWNTVPWPPIGPDVIGGTVYGSSGSTSWAPQSVGGFANDIPALDCFKNIMGGPADGTGSVLNFSASACYNAHATSPTVVQTPCTQSTYATNPSMSCTFASNVTSGDILVIWIWADSQITISAPSGCVSSWSLIGTPANQQAAYIGTANATGTCSITVSGSSSSAGVLAAVGYDLQNAIPTTDGVNYASIAYCTSCSNGSITTSTNNDLILGFVFQGSGTVTIGSPFTSDVSGNVGGIILAAGHYVLTTAGNINMSWSDSGSGNTFSATLAVKP